MLNSHLKMLKQQHFLYQRKNLYDLMPSRSFSGEPISDDNYRFLSLLEFFFIPPSPYFILVSVALGGGGRRTRTWKISCSAQQRVPGCGTHREQKTQINRRT